MFTCLIHRILYIFNQFAKRNETTIIRLINTGGTSGPTSPEYVVVNMLIFVSNNIIIGRHRFAHKRVISLPIRSDLQYPNVLTLFPFRKKYLIKVWNTWCFAFLITYTWRPRYIYFLCRITNEIASRSVIYNTQHVSQYIVWNVSSLEIFYHMY